MTVAQLEQILQNWQQVKENEWLASCQLPENHNHGEANPSLAITQNGDKILVHCRVGCDKNAVWSALCAKIAEQPVSTSPGTLPGPTKETFNASRADVECRSVMERISVASATPTTSPDAQAGGLPFMVLHTRELA